MRFRRSLFLLWSLLFSRRVRSINVTSSPDGASTATKIDAHVGISHPPRPNRFDLNTIRCRLAFRNTNLLGNRFLAERLSGVADPTPTETNSSEFALETRRSRRVGFSELSAAVAKFEVIPHHSDGVTVPCCYDLTAYAPIDGSRSFDFSLKACSMKYPIVPGPGFN